MYVCIYVCVCIYIYIVEQFFFLGTQAPLMCLALAANASQAPLKKRSSCHALYIYCRAFFFFRTQAPLMCLALAANASQAPLKK
jgi:hypothetical protein